MERGTLTICEITEQDNCICIVARNLLNIDKGDIITYDLLHGVQLYIEELIKCNPDDECQWKLICKIVGEYILPILTEGTVLITIAGKVYGDNESRW